MDLGPGVQGGLTGFIILPHKEFGFVDGVPASQVSSLPVPFAWSEARTVGTPGTCHATQHSPETSSNLLTKV